MKLTIKDLEFCFDTAIRFKEKYIAVMIKMEGYPKPEIIVNFVENIPKKLEYYKNAYDENLNLKAAKGIKIAGVASGNTLRDLFHDLQEL